VELYIHSPNTPSCRGAQLKHRDNFTFTFICLVFIKLITTQRHCSTEPQLNIKLKQFSVSFALHFQVSVKNMKCRVETCEICVFHGGEDSSRILLGCDTEWCCRIQHGPPKRWYPTTKLQVVTTEKNST